ncbi:hypothetical protein SLEP1_g19393 [Rubroshorea leprosula]|nr:hypothetical protein SLEP1_g19393 [Rubroshorea leprosula]
MSSGELRRRLHHGDVDGRKHEHYEASKFGGSDEPLLGRGEYDDNHPRKPEDIWAEERRKEHLHWTLLFSQLTAQWAQWLGVLY